MIFELFCNLKNPCIGLALRRVKDVSRYGKVVVNKNGLITLFREKDDTGSGLINGGIYFVDRLIFQFAPEGVYSFEEYIIKTSLKLKGVYGLECKGYFIDIGIPNDLIRARKELPKVIKK